MPTDFVRVIANIIINDFLKLFSIIIPKSKNAFFKNELCIFN